MSKIPKQKQYVVLMPAAASLVALVVYLLTLAPTITWKHNGADSGDLVTAAFTLGIPHPPGYPLFTLISSLFAHFPFVEPARGVGLFVAFCGAVAVWILARAGATLLAPLRSNPFMVWIAPLAALGFALAPALWSQATIVEVYTLGLVFVAILLWAMVSDHPKRIPIAAAALGLGLAHHLSIIFFLPGAWLVLKPTQRDWRAGLLVLAPLLFYAYLPLRALAHPPVNWGNASTLDGFMWEVTGGPYRSYFLNESLGDALSRVQYTARLLFDQFTPVGLGLALWGLWRLVQDRGRLALALGLSAFLVTVYAIVYVSVDSYVYLLYAFAVVLLWLMVGAADLVAQLRAAPLRWGVVALLAILPVYNLIANYSNMDLSGDQDAMNYARSIIDPTPHSAVLFADGDNALFAVTYYRQVIVPAQTRVVIVSQGLLQFDWYYREVQYQMAAESFQPVQWTDDVTRRAESIVDAAMATNRTICFSPSSPALNAYNYTSYNGMYCVTARK
ncbi:MAG: DUF2723 domain-containing protein [Anaerolineae bacterium]